VNNLYSSYFHIQIRYFLILSLSAGLWPPS